MAVGALPSPALVFAASLCAGVVLALLLPSPAAPAAYASVAPAPATAVPAAVSAAHPPQPAARGRSAVAARGNLAAPEDLEVAAAATGAPQVVASPLLWFGSALLAAASLLLAVGKRQPQPRLPGCDTYLSLESLPLADVHWAMASTASQAPVYVVNGFYMAMREKYTQDGAAIRYFLAEWDAAALSWKDFRGKVLGATDPATAPEGSIRRTILETYKDLGLATEPNVGDNGVHASASPFEALVERMNWVGAQLEADDFGQALLAAGVPRETILAWTKDPQVQFEGQSRGLFDVMEDTNVQECLRRAQAIAGVSGPITATKNQAFVFVKPHAMTPQAIELAKSKLAAAGITLGQSGELDNKTIESKMLIDNHYYAIANKASLTKPKDLSVPAARQAEFEQLFGEKWADVLAAGRVFNALDAARELGLAGNALDTVWGAAKKAGRLVKFGGGFYVGQLSL